jgi:hypothetical protein
LIWPKAGCASIVWPQRRRKTFFPWACRPFLAAPRKFRAPVLHCVPSASGASLIASGLQIAIEAAVVAGSKTARR